MYNIKNIILEIFKEYKKNEDIIYSKNNEYGFGKIKEIHLNNNIVDTYLTIISNNNEIDININDIYLKNNPYLNLSIKNLILLISN